MKCKNCLQAMGKAKHTCQSCNKPLHAECAINDGGTFCDVCYIVKTQGGETLSFTIPDVIRRTYIETYRSCPHKFFKEVIEGHTQPQTSYTQIGIDLHEWFDKVCNDRSITKETVLLDMEKKFKEYPDELFSSGFSSDNRDDLLERAISCIDTFFEVTLHSLPVTPFITEETIHYTVGENLPDVQFTMDRIDEIDGELEMHDWKTGKVMVGQKLSSDLQAPLYIYGTKRHYGKPVRSFTFHYLNENKTRVFVRSPMEDDLYICTVGKREYKVRLTDAVREIQSVFSHIIKGNFSIPQNTSKMHFTCKMCHLQKQGLCEGADLQSWNQAKQGQFAWT